MNIYKATNTVNGKVYIGLTNGTLERRISEHKSRAKQGYKVHFYNAIRKYGFDKFEWEFIDCALFYEDLKEREKYWIEYYDSYNKGYNSTVGGDGTVGIDRKSWSSKYSSITEEKAQEILNLLFEGKLSLNEIAKKCGVSLSHVSHLNSGGTWSYLYDGLPPSKAGRKPVSRIAKGEQFKKRTTVTEKEVIEIKRLLSEGVPRLEISKQFGIGQDVVDHIKYRRSWKWLKTEYDDKIVVKPKGKLNDEKVIEIKKLCLQGLSFAKIGEMYNVTPSLVGLIHRGKRWNHVELPVEYNEKERINARSKLNDSKVVEIKKLLNEGMSQTKIAEIYNVTRDTIGKIYRGQSWKHVKI